MGSSCQNNTETIPGHSADQNGLATWVNISISQNKFAHLSVDLQILFCIHKSHFIFVKVRRSPACISILQ